MVEALFSMLPPSYSPSCRNGLSYWGHKHLHYRYGNFRGGRFLCSRHTDREIDILQQLQQAVLEHAESITAICERAGVLDWCVGEHGGET